VVDDEITASSNLKEIQKEISSLTQKHIIEPSNELYKKLSDTWKF